MRIEHMDGSHDEVPDTAAGAFLSVLQQRHGPQRLKSRIDRDAGTNDLDLIPTDGTVETDARLIRLLADRIERTIASVEEVDEGDILTNLSNSLSDIRGIVHVVCSADEAVRDTYTYAMDTLNEAAESLSDLAESHQ